MAQEKDYYGLINQYYTKHAKETIAWEAKLTKTNSIPFKSLAPHQEEKLLKSERVFAYKYPDVGMAQKPYDGSVLVGATAIFIAIYYKPRATRIFEILLRDFLNEKYKSGNKSLTLDRAEQICIKEWINK